MFRLCLHKLLEVQKFSKMYVLLITFIQIKYKLFIRRMIMIKGWKCLRNNKYLAEWKKFQLKERIWNLSSYIFSILTWPIIIHIASDSTTSSTEWRNRCLPQSQGSRFIKNLGFQLRSVSYQSIKMTQETVFYYHPLKCIK